MELLWVVMSNPAIDLGLKLWGFRFFCLAMRIYGFAQRVAAIPRQDHDCSARKPKH